ncbi:ribonuclease P protein subunit RPR2, putative [Plasmodium berghei]|uniref:Ribonuclease P protein subunit RPR2, putative n=2 Tax=Plasmodium berghei TaxID=5821 RepID=A0A509ASE2_PLABA|nr:ribonuclease P protein subunit RPR2, putative [Plasmodium berghei ANKA]CXI99357.1 ribonuclease P protein subunit RPR2, putative [Plasmodium berghei]SCL97859.1 ribonuclease P protein subunit RPR2, putative [Plasmodium berghei]SCM16697.1 ribonuclease P protein subunit RPR2, putative [Plasmodium berghei]SCM18495.1 ribonuclease P protein subunit RPR2, putative [Plasmodium berghei]SCN27928.1 ribonuclease P protein subunit RPR2, putative [Plasmodium berghei]|eukprot:XP_034423581.1 ribonuclease P protein subunit RPR2, putative [Plasmodium berghei ANKA]
MHNSKHESYINEELLLKNEDNCEQLKNKANNPNDNGNNSNNVTKCDNMEEKGNYNFVDNTKNLEKTNIPLSRGLNENSQINQLHTNKPKKRKKRTKKCNDNKELLKPSNQMVRINYLLQASFLMNKFSPNLSRKYIKTMRRLSNKFLIKYDKNFKKLFCKKCNSVFIPNVTCNIFVNPLNIQKKNKNHIVKNSISTNESVKERDECLVSYQCNHCQHITKFVYENNLPIPIENENITTV